MMAGKQTARAGGSGGSRPKKIKGTVRASKVQDDDAISFDPMDPEARFFSRRNRDGMYKVYKVFERAGVKEAEMDKVSKCLMAGILNGYIPWKKKDPLNHEICTAMCKACEMEVPVTIEDVMFQPDNPTAEGNEQESKFSCPRAGQDGYKKCGSIYITGLCNGKFQSAEAKKHNHCIGCPQFGKCELKKEGSGRRRHCLYCNEHYIIGRTAKSNPCHKEESPKDADPEMDMREETTVYQVYKMLEKAGVAESDMEKVSNCLKAGIKRRFILLEEENPLDKEIYKTKCEMCSTSFAVKIRDVLFQLDYGRRNCEKGGGLAPLTCPDEDCAEDEENEGMFITGLCSDRFRTDCGKSHNHCTECPGFGMCVGDYRQQHCNKCMDHPMMYYPCPTCYPKQWQKAMDEPMF